MAAESSTPRTSMIEIFPLSGKPTSNQRQSGAAESGATNSAEPNRAEMIFLAGTFAEPAKRKRGGRCWRNNCFSGVSSLRTAFRILEGNLPARRSSLSTTWSNDGVFTGELVPDLPVYARPIAQQWKIHCRTQMFGHIEIRVS